MNRVPQINRPFQRPAASRVSRPSPGEACPEQNRRSEARETEPAPETSIYRERTLSILRRYFRLSIQIGRLPSLVGREFFGGRASSYRMETFEDVVVFVHDVERCLARLDPSAQQLIGRIVFQEYTIDEAARLLHISRNTVFRHLPDAIDRVSAMLLEAGMLRHQDLTRAPRRRRFAPVMQELEEVLELQPATLEASCDCAAEGRGSEDTEDTKNTEVAPPLSRRFRATGWAFPPQIRVPRTLLSANSQSPFLSP